MNADSNPYRSPESVSNLGATPAAPRRQSILIPAVAFLGSAVGGAAIGLIVTFLHWWTDDMNPLDRWPMFWAYVTIGSVTGMLVGGIWAMSMLFRIRYRR